ncbi:MAG: HEAT repeat domain-containing protein [Tildeniella nuda ZEHNDER 1965/U140]|jgi:HEAT repeat protein|nr:HEAT repeat domain-containing protein [Tildeniella nuda ZEHNDER 1965/U140]
MVFESIAGGLVKAALPKVAGAIATAVKDKLHPTQLQRSLEIGLRESGAFDRGQKVNNAVFYHWEPGRTDTFLAALLNHPDVQRELQKPLEQEGTLDVEILVQAARHVATTHNLTIATDPLEIWLTAFANAYFNAITAIRFQVAKANYLKQLANWFDDVKFAGVAVPGQDVERAERLAQIFVMPDVEEDGGQRSRLAFERSLFEEQGEQGRQGELLQEQRMRAQLERSGRKFSARQLLNQHQKKIVLLGAPGSGKTTLMSFFAVTLAERQGAGEAGGAGGAERQGAIALASDASTEGIDRDAEGSDRDAEGSDRDRSQMQRDTTRMQPHTEGLRLDTEGLQTDTDALPLPILIRIRDWARTPDVTLPEYARQFAETTMSCKALPKGFFEHWLNNGRALILLDGLDEVAEESKRYHLVQCIENFLGQYPQNRAIITSRPAGYKRDFFRMEEFPHYELQPFDDGKIEEFCDRWYRSRVQDTAEAQRRRESLQKALGQQDRIKLLARNPLLLTIIALIHRYQARLPRERYKLYDKAVETLLTAWDDNKELSNQTVLKYLQLDDLRRLMESLAYWIHTQGSTGDTEGGTLIDKDELIQKLCQEIKTLKQLQHYEAKAEAERFVKFSRDRTGLLNEQGQDCYAFVHKTFQEYLAAQDINYQADNEDDFEIILTHIEQHLHDPHWREVLLLLIAQQSPKKAARAIRKVLTANSPYEQWLHRDLLFAGRGLAEDPKSLSVADPALGLEILTRLIELEKSKSPCIAQSTRNQVFEVVCSLSESEFETQSLQLLKSAADDIEQIRLQQYRIALGEREEALAHILMLLRGTNCEMRRSAAKALGKLGDASEPVLQGLLAGLQDEDSYVLRFSAIALSELGCVTETVRQAIFEMLKREKSDTPSAGAAIALVKLASTTGMTSQHILPLLKHENCAVRVYIAFGLGYAGDSSEEVVRALLPLLKDENESVRFNTARALCELGDTSSLAVQELLSLMANSKHKFYISESIFQLGKLGNNSDSVIQALRNKLIDESPGVIVGTTSALLKLGEPSETLLPILLSCLESYIGNTDEMTRNFQHLDQLTEVPIQTLLVLLENEDAYIRRKIAKALVKVEEKSSAILPAIVQWIEQHQDEECVGAGIDALWEIVEGV